MEDATNKQNMNYAEYASHFPSIASVSFLSELFMRGWIVHLLATRL